MITLLNKQRSIRVDTKRLKKDAQTILNHLGYRDFDLSIALVSDKVMHTYNKQYRRQDKPTDILSFPFHPDLKAGQHIKAKTDLDKNLGDLIIAPAYVTHDLPRWGQTFEQRMRVLLVHGICHLLGYDHIKDSDYKIMHAKEEELLNLLD